MAATHLDALLTLRHETLAVAADHAALADALEEAGLDALAERARSAEPCTPAASRFIDDVSESWDSLDPFLATAEAGYLAEPDEDLLRQLCEEESTLSDYAASEADVMLFVFGHVAACRMREAADE